MVVAKLRFKGNVNSSLTKKNKNQLRSYTYCGSIGDQFTRVIIYWRQVLCMPLLKLEENS